MADPRFFQKSPALTLGDIAAAVKGSVREGDNADLLIDDVAPLDRAGPGQLSFLDNIKYKSAFASSKAAACIVSEAMAQFAPEGMALIISKSPYKSYALAAQAFYPDNYPAAQIASGAYVDPAATIG
ncbi:MAG: UDP-3-O-(3-hydroxymyristoyl)glucosamine N-acyltransferase, partial [Micavibrio aeruginosavorus]